MDGIDRVAVVTGANSGIGKDTAKALVERGFRTVLGVRSLDRGRAAADEIEAATGRPANLLELDLGSFDSIRRAADSFIDGFGRLDVFVNNAAFADWGNDRQETIDGFERTFGTNHLGPFLLTNLLVDVLVDGSARVVNVTSEFGYKLAADGLDFDDLNATRSYNGVLAYGRSKLANIYFTRELAQRLAPAGVTVNCVCPGYVATNLGVPRDGEGPPPVRVDEETSSNVVDVSSLPKPMPSEQGAQGPVHLSTDPSVGDLSGEFFRGPKLARLRPPATDPDAPARLWEVSERLVGLQVASG